MPEASCTLSSTMEDYLEVIGRLVARRGSAHVKEIAEALSVHMSTVTTALRCLSEKGLVDYAPYKAATLTSEGRKEADRIVGRHEALREFLSDILLVSDSLAEENACRMEHVLDREVMEHLSLFARFVRECPRAGDEWLDRFRYFLEHPGGLPKDERVVKRWLRQFQRKVGEQSKGKKPNILPLDELEPGRKAQIVKVGGDGPLSRRLLDMGVVEGTLVEVLRVAPAADQIEVKIKGYSVALPKEEAGRISVEY